MSTYLFGSAHDLRHLRDGMHANDVRARKDRCRDRGRRRPVAFESGSIARGFA